MATDTNDEQQAFERFADAVTGAENEVINLMLIKKLGQMTDKERDRARSLCESDVYNHPYGSEKRIFYCGEFLVGFSSRWIHDVLDVAVKTADGNENSLFTVSKRDYR